MKKATWIGIFTAACIFVMIIDGKTALQGASEGIEICLRTVMPSLFPLFFLSCILINIAPSLKIPGLPLLCKICKLPGGSESLFLIGTIGGYPVGAQSIYTAYSSKQLTKKNAQRMLAFCNNAGPSMIFGIVGRMFDHPVQMFALWGVQIACAILTARIIPRENDKSILPAKYANDFDIRKVFGKSIHAIGSVCGWIILFRTLIRFLQNWFLRFLPPNISVCVIGTLEATNGCIGLLTIPNPQIRFMIASAICAFGGLCVMLQTYTVIRDLDFKYYIWGKITQTAISIPLSMMVAAFLFPGNILYFIFGFLGIVILFLLQAAGKIYKKYTGNWRLHRV